MTDTRSWSQAYLAEFDRAAASLPAERRAELRAEVADHLDQALGHATDADAAREALARLGEPEALVAAAAADLPAPAQSPAGPSGAEIVALLLLGLGGVIVPLLGPAVGVMIMRTTPRWSRSQVRVAWGIVGIGVLALLFGVVLMAATTQASGFAVVAGLTALAVVMLVGPAAALYAATRPRT